MTLDRISIEVTNRCAKACWHGFAVIVLWDLDHN